MLTATHNSNSSEAGHRFEVGTCVMHIGTRLPSGVRRIDLVVSERLASMGEPQYLLHSPDRGAPYKLAESQLMRRW